MTTATVNPFLSVYAAFTKKRASTGKDGKDLHDLLRPTDDGKTKRTWSRHASGEKCVGRNVSELTLAALLDG